MGVILKKFVDDDCLLGIWEITEDYDTLYSQKALIDEEKIILESFQNYQRKLEWLSVRVLINELLGKECKIVYNDSHKPFLADNSHHISISHSKSLTAIIVSKNKRVGIDLEFMSHQIHNIAEKFINEEERVAIDPDHERFHLYIHWCAKEALYKICDKQDINFKKNLTIQPFELKKEGKLKGIVHNRYGEELFSLNYFSIDGYVIVWCNK
jgi:4'-phosphopantetheinyl transferase EntD